MLRRTTAGNLTCVQGICRLHGKGTSRLNHRAIPIAGPVVGGRTLGLQKLCSASQSLPPRLLSATSPRPSSQTLSAKSPFTHRALRRFYRASPRTRAVGDAGMTTGTRWPMALSAVKSWSDQTILPLCSNCLRCSLLTLLITPLLKTCIISFLICFLLIVRLTVTH